MRASREILGRAEFYRNDMLGFLRELCAIPSQTGREREVILRIRREMEKVGFDEIKIDGMGNILGRIGSGERIIAMDGHVDTVGIGDRASWKWDPHKGKFENGILHARGASDQKGGVASLIYGAKIIKDLNLTGDYSLWITGTVQEEDCEGLCWLYILREGLLKPEVVVITEPTGLTICRGQRGRMEIGITARGVSCHASAPKRGRNAIYMISAVIREIEQLNARLGQDDFLGDGTIAVTYVECSTPSRCAIPDRAYIHVDRRLTRNETREEAVRQVDEAVRKAGVEAEVEVLQYSEPSYTNLIYKTEKYFPSWTLDSRHRACRAAVCSFRAIFDAEPQIGKWDFSTNGVATMGLMGIPTFGFGPGDEVHAHTVQDQVPVEHLVHAAAFYAGFPLAYCVAE